MKRALLGSTALLIIVSFLVVPQAIYAISITGDMGASTSGLGNFQGSFTYNPSLASLEVQLTNTTSAPATQAFITAFAFNNPGGITGVTLTSTDTNFGLLGATSFNNGINGQPFGDFDIGASTGSSFQGGGSPNVGIAIGGTATFTFNFTGTLLNTLTDDDFVSTLSSPRGNDDSTEFFVVRFRGIDAGDGSDKVPASVPEPNTVLLLGSGLLGLAFLGRRLRNRKT